MSTEAENTPFDWRKDPWYGGQFRVENMSKFPAEKLAEYMGQVVAWYPDGSGICASGPSMDVVWEKLEGLGENPQLFLFEYLEAGERI